MWRSIEVTPKPCKQRNSSALAETAPVGDSTDEPRTLSYRMIVMIDLMSLSRTLIGLHCAPQKERRGGLVTRILMYKVTQAFSSVR